MSTEDKKNLARSSELKETENASASTSDISEDADKNISTAVSKKTKRRFRPFRWLFYFLTLLLITLIILLCVVWIWSGRDGSLAQAIALAKRFVPVVEQSLTAENVYGSLRSGGQIAYLRWQQDQTVDVQAYNITVQWDLKTLLKLHAQVDHASVGLLQVSIPTSTKTEEEKKPSEPLQNISLPVTIDAQDLRVSKFVLRQGEQNFTVAQTQAQYKFDGDAHHLDVLSLRTYDTDITAKALLTAKNPEIEAQVNAQIFTMIPGADQQIQGQAQANVSGPLTNLWVVADVQVDEIKPVIAPVIVPVEHEATKNENVVLANEQAKTDLVDPLQPKAPQKLHLQAQITPWENLIIPQATLKLDAINIGALWPQAPQTLLFGQADLTSTREHSDLNWEVVANIRNELVRTIDQNGLPVNSIDIKAALQNNFITLHELNIFVDDGQLAAKGRLNLTPQETKESTTKIVLPPYNWQLSTTIDGIDLQKIYSSFTSEKIKGVVSAEKNNEGLAYFIKVTPEKTGQNMKNVHLQNFQASGIWTDEIIHLNALLLKTNNMYLEGKGKVLIPVESDNIAEMIKADGQLKLNAPGIETQFQIVGLTAKAGSVTTNFQLKNAKETLQWLQKVPELSKSIKNYQATGSLSAKVSLQNGWKNPNIDAKLDSSSFSLSQKADDASEQVLVQLKELHASLNGSIEQAVIKTKLGAILQDQLVEIDMEGRGGLTNNDVAYLKLARFDSKIYRLTSAKNNKPSLLIGMSLASPTDIRWQNETLELTPSSINLSFPTASSKNAPSISWQKTTWKPDGELSSKGSISEFPVLWLTTFSEARFSGMNLGGDLMLKGSWSLQMGSRLDFSAEVGRTSGDLYLEQDVSAFASIGQPQMLKAGVKDFKLNIHNEDSKLLASLIWDTENMGVIDVALATNMQKEGKNWTIKPDAALTGHIKAQLNRIDILSALAPMGWRFGGNANIDSRIEGSLSRPAIKGQLAVSNVNVRSVLDGVGFQDGELLMVFDGNNVHINTLTLKGSGNDGGLLSGKGTISWTGEKPQAALTINLEKFKASPPSDRLIILSGQTHIALKDNTLDINGALKIDKALIILVDDSAPQLDDDVVIISKNDPPAPKKEKVSSESIGFTPHVQMMVDLGEDFRVQGYGLQTYLEGLLNISNKGFEPLIMGQISTKDGKFRAYGQKLDIESGHIIFNGPYSNPTLNILAIRPQTQEKVGVKVSGTAMHPKIALYSASGLSDSDTLSWLLLGRAPSAGGTESAILQQAALALLSGDGQGLSEGFANALGLDELSIGGGGDDSLSGTTITIGKRLSDKVYVAYVQSLSGATSAFHVLYQVSKRLSLRAEIGEKTATDIIYSFRFN